MSKSLIEHQMEINVIELTIWFDNKQPIKFINYSEALDCRGLDKKSKAYVYLSSLDTWINVYRSQHLRELPYNCTISVPSLHFNSVCIRRRRRKQYNFSHRFLIRILLGFFFLESWRFSLIHYFDITYGCKLKQTKPTKRFLLSIIHEKKAWKQMKCIQPSAHTKKKKQKQSKQRNR